jgi:cell division septum initiation protein DivIVA
MRRKEMKQLLEERIERISLLETRIDTMEQLVDGYRAREQSIIDTLHGAKESAAKTNEDAKTRADAMLSEAKRHADSALADAQLQATAMIEEANRRADELISSARAESDRMLQSAEATKNEYEQMVVTFNTLLEQNAIEAAQSASRYAEFIKGRIISPTKNPDEEDDLFSSVAAEQEKTLPDPGNDPARLMQNIYQLQNRPIPEGVQPETTETTAAAAPDMPDLSIFEEDEPRPRYARTTDSQEAAPEQPDDSEALNVPYPSITDTMKLEEFGIFPQSEPEQPEPIKEEYAPFSEKAWESEEHQSPSEPQAEFTTAFDTEYPETDFSLLPDAECTVQNMTQEQEPEPARVEPEPVRVEPEPFSEAAWSHAGESESEPQAEFSTTYTVTDEKPESDFNIDEAAEFAANFDAAVADTGETTHEWQPESEPDADESPSVGEILPNDGGKDEDEISLDDLLDEIIKAGE